MPHFGHVLEHGDAKGPTRFLLADGVQAVCTSLTGFNLVTELEFHFANLRAIGLLRNQLRQAKAESDAVDLATIRVGNSPGFVKAAAA